MMTAEVIKTYWQLIVCDKIYFIHVHLLVLLRKGKYSSNAQIWNTSRALGYLWRKFRFHFRRDFCDITLSYYLLKNVCMFMFFFFECCRITILLFAVLCLELLVVV